MNQAQPAEEIVLVHGAWHGGWCWQRVVDRLEEAGRYRTWTPTLRGLGSRRDELAPDVGLHAHADDIVTLLEEHDLTDVVLVGHSYGGFVVREAADRVADRVRGIVMLDAWVGADGDSMADRAPAWFMDRMRAAADEQGDGWAMPPVLPELIGVTDPDDVAWLNEMCSPQPLRTFTEATRLTGAVDALPHAAIVCDDAGLPFQAWAEERGWPVATIGCGHDAMVIDPNGLAARIDDAVATFPRR